MKNKSIFLIGVGSLLSHSVISQNMVTVNFEGLSPEQYSPFLYNELADHGIQNPERGFEVKAGVIDLFPRQFNPDPTFDFNYMQFQEKGDDYYENIVNGDPNLGITPLEDYLNNRYCKDGISLVEIEEYVNFTTDNLLNHSPIRSQDIIDATSVFETLPALGVKAHLVMNSSYQIFNQDPSTNPNSHETFEYFSSNNPTNNFPNGTHTLGLEYYIDQMQVHYQSISPYVANVHLGWISAPHDRNMFRHSAKWAKSSAMQHAIYPIGSEMADQHALPLLSNNVNLLKNEHGDFRESKQRFDWSVAHGEADAWHYNSNTNLIRVMVIDKMLNYFPHQKILLSSMYPWSNHLGTKAPLFDPALTNYSAHYEPIFHDFYSGNNISNYPYFSNLLTNDNLKKQRIGYYDGHFGGETYSHLWTIGNGETQQIHWRYNYFNLGSSVGNDQFLGQDWRDNRMNVDSYLLRKYRENMWNHGELPVFETTDYNVCGTYGSPFRSFTSKHYGMSNWIQSCGATDPVLQYNWEIAKQMTDGRLQDGFKSALKMRYFNFTSFNIGHNHLLDARSPYEFRDNQQTTWTQSYPTAPLLMNPTPSLNNTVVTKWKNDDVDLYNDLTAFHMPVSDNYFGENGDIVRSPYEYMRDHLGYRLELQEVEFGLGTSGLGVHAKVINKGFAAPQNPRTFYFVLMDYNTNEILQTVMSNAEWRNWQPDDFATGIDNQEDPNGYSAFSSVDIENSIANSKVGGIPLGDYKVGWHDTPLPILYSPFEHTFSTNTDFNLSNLPNGDYKIGIWCPDPDANLHNEPKYNVKFANQLSYIHSNGVNVIGSITKTSNGIIPSNDTDADGISNAIDNHPNNPTEYNGGHDLSQSNSCFGFPANSNNQSCNNY